MNRYEQLKKIYLSLLDEKSHGYYKKEAYEHTFGVVHLCVLLAKKRGLNEELCAIMALFHDLSTAIYASSFNHGSRSADLLSKYLKDFNNEEKDILLTSISSHSNKDKVGHDYEECLKDGDVFQRYLMDSSYKEHINRIEKVKKELDM